MVSQKVKQPASKEISSAVSFILVSIASVCILTAKPVINQQFNQSVSQSVGQSVRVQKAAGADAQA